MLHVSRVVLQSSFWAELFGTIETRRGRESKSNHTLLLTGQILRNVQDFNKSQQILAVSIKYRCNNFIKIGQKDGETDDKCRSSAISYRVFIFSRAWKKSHRKTKLISECNIFFFFAAVQQSANPIDVERRFALQRKIFLKIAHTYIPNPPSSWLVRSVRAVQRTFIISKSEEKGWKSLNLFAATHVRLLRTAQNTFREANSV